MSKIYMSENILFEVEVRDKVIKEMKERKTNINNIINEIIKEYFEIKKLLESVPAVRK